MLTRCMALRVLLADESVTIKKVFQLALQDFAVEITTVNVGLDVLKVATKVRPDIIFADVLLQKRNGYEVCAELKANPDFSATPVVLIWSGFMELDEARYKSSGANAHLEKPFDTDKLRKIVQNLVPKTKSNPLSAFLNFPKLPDFEESPVPKSSTSGAPENIKPIIEEEPTRSHSISDKDVPPPPPPEASHSGTWTMDNFAPMDPLQIADEDVSDDFLEVPLPSEPPKIADQKPDLFLDENADEAQWVQKTLSKFKLDESKQTETEPKIKFKQTNLIEAEKLQHQTAKKPIDAIEDELELDLSDSIPVDVDDEEVTANKVPSTASALPPTLSEEELVKIIRAQSQEVIEKVVWQIVPEIATRIIERELDRLLKEQKTL